MEGGKGVWGVVEGCLGCFLNCFGYCGWIGCYYAFEGLVVVGDGGEAGGY